MQWAVMFMLTAASMVAGQETVTLDTQYGRLRGVRVAVGDSSYVDKFLNIPYAKPPLGDLRFRSPRSPEVWRGVRDATQFGSQCLQEQDLPSQHFPNDEDCLYLNVYTPKVEDSKAVLPVMMWIHGGAYVTGTGNSNDWTRLADNGVVVVSINYRLRVLGFLSTEDAASVGNYGLQDQIQALKWIRNTISSFHGDPNNVTIFGESAGSGSVSLLVLSSAARGLFHKAIMESGVSLSPWAVGYPGASPEAKQHAVKLARYIGCDQDDTNLMVNCLRTKDAFEITNASIALQISFHPVIDSTFSQHDLFVDTPETIWKNNWFANVPTIRGFNHDESAFNLQDVNDDGFTLEEVRSLVQSLCQHNLQYAPFKVDPNTVASQLMEVYIFTPNITNPKELRQVYIQLYSDFNFIVPALYELQQATQHNISPQFLYDFNYRSENRLNEPWKGASHADEIPYVSGAPVAGIQAWPGFVSSWTDDDIRVSQDVMTMWSNFAKYGDPTPNVTDGVKWLPWTQTAEQFLDIGSSVRMVRNTVTPQQRLWLDIFTKLYTGSESGNIIG